ncbi:RagB/SusD family nutrient uptake outer membrane protein [Larkinella punicea]|uniref:RagB/SusD family nutrient uptake outer membrane protein n=1 Tax=Larkinella punicea TaxID=2315727 RepID=A0A368JLP4_9BACT|nr:RagB/SusD family nutrient uptake outer membrane protein [Larkinella punicea]RCR68580.1 RagB/SusD family nutrient uptake outer membrane protein [Larkinella punicea]
MKKILISCFVLLSCLSCSDQTVEVMPTDQLTNETVWSTPQNASLFLNDVYNSLNAGPWSSVFTNVPTEVSNDPLDNYSDNSVNGNLAGIPSYTLFANNTYGPNAQIFGPQWSRMYANIRKCNLFLEKVAVSSFDEATKKSMLAQARFLRAYFYTSLINLYGGVPLITKVLNRNAEEEINYPRNTYAECVTFVQEECTKAAADLPATIAGVDLGRVTKGAALALKGELELYAGKWADAAATNQQIMQLNVYELFADYGGLFYSANENNKEVIFDVQYAPNIKGHARDTYWGVTMLTNGLGWGSVNPTQNLVDDYEFLDGKTAAEGSAQYDPKNPYVNRDKRFAASILYDGTPWIGGQVIYTRLGIANNNNAFDASGSGGKNRTGYFLKKLLDPAVMPSRDNLNNATGGSNSIVFRYAEVLLNYAEAKNELSGPDQTVYDAMNKIRTRAGLPNLPTGLSQEQMRQRIRRERRVELAFEGKRLFDLWRWRIAPDVFSKPLKAMKIATVNGTLTYEVVNVGGGTIRFDPAKNYLMPIPQAVIDQNPKIVQNPGY